ncbi:MAG: protein kinase [Acidobacteria bacterium]|nr:protein kinase [Acidobacteriota bacterium]
MTPERWQHIKHLVNSALEQNAEQRSAVLQQSCADDLSLRRGAEALLSFHEQATRNLVNAPAQAIGKLSSVGTMPPERWQQIEQIFQSALELDAAQRAAFLAEACGNDDELRHEVEALLVFQTGMSGVIQGAVQQAAGLLDNSTAKARFTPGMTLNKRYRIIGLLGRGGMGEVYRADDLKLGHPVALKFLTEKLSNDKAMLTRFHSEVSMAHRVTHPNVCRVHDIGEVTTSSGKLHFLSMEYVDGEDLSSLLRRIGRLPADKAVEIANQLCAGLAAAHEAGVLHRDLKPANVMLDGKGRVRITDFGLAGFAEQIGHEEVFAGTPAYMSPEQFAGKEVTTKSDIYALGLVLYEIFTGKRVFEANSLQELQRLHESSSPPNPSNWVKDIDPLVERVILRCLEKDPAKRLASAKQVADALPGGDPLAAALALGETPSPEMVAASGQKTGLRPPVAVVCLITIIVGLLALVYDQSRRRMFDVTPFEHSPEILSQKAREISAQLGYPERPTDSAQGFEYDGDYLNYVRRQIPASEWWQRFSRSRPAPIFFWYRKSPQQLLPKDDPDPVLWGQLPDMSRVRENDPPQTPGMVCIKLDMQGRLLRFSAEPPTLDEGPSHSSQPAQDNWARLFSAAEIDVARLTATEPKWTPPSAFDTRAAWSGTFPEQPDLPLRVEAAAWHGKPVYFEVIGQWTTPNRGVAVQLPSKVVVWFLTVTYWAILLFGGWLAWRNLRQGRGDRKGAFRLMAYIFLSYQVAIYLGSQMTAVNEGMGFYLACFTWILYMSLEPYVRRRWPDMLISWSRVLAGKVRDPLVGRDILFGILAIILLSLLFRLISLLRINFFDLAPFPGTLATTLKNLSSLRLTISSLVILPHHAMFIALWFLFFFFLLRILVRRDWLAIALFALICGLAAYGSWVDLATGILLWLVGALLMWRYGLVAFASFLLTSYATSNFPYTLDFSRWYAAAGLIPLIAMLTLAVFAFYTSLGGQKVFTGKLLEE